MRFRAGPRESSWLARAGEGGVQGEVALTRHQPLTHPAPTPRPPPGNVALPRHDSR